MFKWVKVTFIMSLIIIIEKAKKKLKFESDYVIFLRNLSIFIKVEL